MKMQVSRHRQRFCGSRHRILSFVNLVLICGFAIWKTVYFSMQISHPQEDLALTLTNQSTSTGERATGNPKNFPSPLVKFLNSFFFFYALNDIFSGFLLIYNVYRRSKGNYSKLEDGEKTWTILQFLLIIALPLGWKHVYPVKTPLDTFAVVSDFIGSALIVAWKLAMWLIFSSSAVQPTEESINESDIEEKTDIKVVTQP